MRLNLKRDSNLNFLNGVPELLVLQLLKGREIAAAIRKVLEGPRHA